MKLSLGAVVGLVLSIPGIAIAQNDQAAGATGGPYFPPSQPNAAPATSAPVASTDPGSETSAGTPAQSYQDVTAGSWNTIRQVNSGVTTCALRGTSTAGDPLFLFAATDAPGYLTLQMSKSAWSIPPKTPIRLHAAFDNGVTVDLQGAGEGNIIKAPIDADLLRPWIHGFTAANDMEIGFVGGTAAAWDFTLRGTTATIGAMAECAKEADLYLPAPYNTGTAPRPTGDANGQPFAISTPAAQPSPPTDENPAASTANPKPEASDNPADSASSEPTSSNSQPQNGSCKEDWRACKDNADLVNNYSNWLDVQFACREKANSEVEYGTPIWPGFWSGGAFGSFLRGSDYISTGIGIAIEPDVQIQNQFGAMVHSSAYCRYDLNAKTVLSVTISPN
jgi:hypothetical protein